MILQVSVAVVWFCALLGACLLTAPGQYLKTGLAFGAVALLACAVRPEPGWVGLLVGLVAGWQLIAPSKPRTTAMLAGVLTGLACALHIASGVEAMVAVPLAAVSLVGGYGLVRGYCDGMWVKSGLALCALLAVVTGFAPDVVTGWNAATALGHSATAAATQPVAIPFYVTLLILAALAAGIVRGGLSR